jgi:hypothetical protein
MRLWLKTSVSVLALRPLRSHLPGGRNRRCILSLRSEQFLEYALALLWEPGERHLVGKAFRLLSAGCVPAPPKGTDREIPKACSCGNSFGTLNHTIGAFVRAYNGAKKIQEHGAIRGRLHPLTSSHKALRSVRCGRAGKPTMLRAATIPVRASSPIVAS